MTKRIFNLTTVASGAALAMLIAGALAIIGGQYDKKVVRDQLRPQKIFFPVKGKELPVALNKYAGQQVDTAAEAKAYADQFIAVHLKGIGQGQTYSQVSAKFLQDPKNAELAQTRQTLFMGETLRGLLLNAWGWGTVGSIATIAGIALLVIGSFLLAIPLLARRKETAPAGIKAKAIPA